MTSGIIDVLLHKNGASERSLHDKLWNQMFLILAQNNCVLEGYLSPALHSYWACIHASAYTNVMSKEYAAPMGHGYLFSVTSPAQPSGFKELTIHITNTVYITEPQTQVYTK